MTLPQDILFPKPQDYQVEVSPKEYLDDLVFSLQDMYEQVANVANGSFRNSQETDSTQWLPELAGTTSAGSFTYVNQYGWSVRSGIMVDLYIDISWTATTATGNLYLKLPYRVTKSAGIPFVGVCQTTLTYTAGTYCTINAIPNTYRGEFYNSGNGVAMQNQVIRNTGRVVAHLRYIGVTDE